MPTATDSEILEILCEAKQLARRYHALTGKPLDLHTLRGFSEARGRHCHVLRIKWYVRETEIPLTICSGRPIVAANRVMNLDGGIGNHRARRVQDGAAN